MTVVDKSTTFQTVRDSYLLPSTTGLPNGSSGYLFGDYPTDTLAWAFKYRSAAPTFKWLYVGGSPLYASSAATQTLANHPSTWTALPTPVTLTMPGHFNYGSFWVTIGADITLTTIVVSGTVDVSAYLAAVGTYVPDPAIGAATMSRLISILPTVAGTTTQEGSYSKRIQMQIGGSETIALQYKATVSGSSAATLNNVWMEIEPIAVVP